MKKAGFLLIFGALLCSFTPDAQAAFLKPADIQIRKDGVALFAKPLLTERGAIVGSVAFADLGRDGVDELLIGSGTGMSPKVSAFRADGSKLFQFVPFSPEVREGLVVAAGDLDGKGVRNIVVGQRFPGKPVVAIFSANGKAIRQFSAFDTTRPYGLSLATGDVDGDGTDEIITAEGPLGGREVRIYHGDGSLFTSFSAFSSNEEGAGITVAATDLNGDGKAEVITGQASQGSRVQVWNVQSLGAPMYEWSAFDPDFIGGVYVSVDATTGDHKILASPAGTGAGYVKSFSPSGELFRQEPVFDPTYDGVVLTATARGSTVSSLSVIAPSLPVYYPSPVPGKSIRVNRTEQRVYAWENGYLMRSYLTSTGLKATPTPAGEFSVLKKVEYVNYTRIYGVNDPRNYRLPNTRWNVQFKPSYYIHTAYWHNNFGKPMSHGCVNTFIEDAKWTYAWADVGTPVSIQ